MKRNLLLLALVMVQTVAAQVLVPIKYGDMESWVVRNIKESGVIGGKTRTLYELGPNTTINEAAAYKNLGGSPWGSSNVYCKVSGITKTNCTMKREKRGNGYCARLETEIVGVKVLGMINIKVLAAGSLFLGQTIEPIKDTNNPMSKISAGMRLDKRPKALIFDYKTVVPDTPNRIYKSAGSSKEVKGRDMPDVICLLQKRWEDEEGNIHAKRVGTIWQRFSKTTPDWINGARFEFQYGDIQGTPYYKSYMNLITGENTKYALNSKGVNVKIIEEGWASEDEEPTHIILQFDSSFGGAYVGTPGSTLWIDNVKLEY